MALNGRDLSCWPAPLRQAVDSIAVMLMQVFMLARGRAASSASPVVRTLAGRDEEAWKLAIREREIGVFRRRLEALPAHKRPQIVPEDRFEVLQLMRLRGLSVEQAAERYVLHPNTIWGWIRQFKTGQDVGSFFGKAPFNRISDAGRWLVHEIRRLCPEREFGTRSIAMAIVRAGIQLSRSSVQRILREKRPAAPAPAKPAAVENEARDVPRHILRPKKPNRTWHLDMMTVDFFFVRYYVAAVLDGFSRKLLGLRVFRDAPTSMDAWRLVRSCIAEFGAPRFLVTDHGCQFRAWFRRLVEKRGVALVKGRKRSCHFNGKVERFFKTLRVWQRLTLFAWKLDWIQRRLDVFRDWYNGQRAMWIHMGRTPDEVYRSTSRPESLPARRCDPQIAFCCVRRVNVGGDHHLPMLDIRYVRRIKKTA
jgi:transposase InsO family protein